MTQVGKESFPFAQPDRARPVPQTRRKRDYALAVILFVSLAIHATVLLPMLFSARTAAPPSVETPVEVIQEPPSEPKKEPAKSGKNQAKDAQEQAEKAKAEKAKAEQAKAEQAKAEQAKAEQDKAEKAKEDQAKADQAKAEQAKAERAKAEKAEHAKPKPTEHKVAKADRAKPQPQKPPPQAPPAETQEQVDARMRSLLGLPQSLDHAALPGVSANGTEGATYEQLVMSSLTKAVSMERRAGRPGYATVTFVVGDAGDVVSVVLNRPSGDPLLDSEATEVVKRAAPFPIPTPGSKREFTVTLQSRPVM